jgi:class 3 adenylate cyclase
MARMARRPGGSSIDAIASLIQTEGIDLPRDRTSPEGALTVMFSDLEGSTAMVERLGEQRWFQVLQHHNAVVREQVDAHGGQVVKSQGDGFMIVFDSARAGLRCAIAIQRAFAGQAHPETGEELRVRIGLNAGFVIEDAQDFYGKAVILAARIGDQARGGEILVSDTLKVYVERDPTFEFARATDVELKGFTGLHTLYAARWEPTGNGG